MQLGPVEAEAQPKPRPIVPKGHDLLDSLPVEVAEDLLSRAMGDLKPLDWNALEQEQRDERVLAALDADNPAPEEGEPEPAMEGSGDPEREDPQPQE